MTLRRRSTRGLHLLLDAASRIGHLPFWHLPFWLKWEVAFDRAGCPNMGPKKRLPFSDTKTGGGRAKKGGGFRGFDHGSHFTILKTILARAGGVVLRWRVGYYRKNTPTNGYIAHYVVSQPTMAMRRLIADHISI